MYNDPSGEIFGIDDLLISAIIIGAIIGAVSYTIAVIVTGQKFNFFDAFKSTIFGAIGGAVTFGVGSIFSSATSTALTAVGSAIKEAVGGVGLAVIQGAAHAITQGILGVMQGGNFISSATAGFFGSLGAAGFGAVAGKFAQSAVGTIAFGAVAGGVGSALTGGNFWQGAIIGGMVAGLNDVMHGNFGKKYDVSVLEDYEGANGAGHQGIAFENKDSSLRYISKDGTAGENPIWGESDYTDKTFKTYDEINDYYSNKTGGKRYDVIATYRATKIQINAGIKTALSYAKADYNLITNSCTTMVQKAMSVMFGVLIPSINTVKIPNVSFNTMRIIYNQHLASVTNLTYNNFYYK